MPPIDDSTLLVLVFVSLLLTMVSLLYPAIARGQDREDAYADLSNSLGTNVKLPIWGRVVEEEDRVDVQDARPGREASQDEFENLEVEVELVAMGGAAKGRTIALGKVTTDDEGYLDKLLTLPANTAPGRYALVVKLDGREIGRAHARLLDRDQEGVVVRSDVDLTWLDTDFHSKRAMARLLMNKAKDRRALPGMSEVYKALRKGASGLEDRPLVFISGSPRFFKRTLDGKLQLDGVEADGLILKPFKNIVSSRIGALEPGQIVPALEEQIGYKLEVLLRTRLALPRRAAELLMGDDSEADFVVYNLYHRVTSGALSPEALVKELTRLGVSRHWMKPIEALLPEVLGQLGSFAPVRAIYINKTGIPAKVHKPEEWALDGVLFAHEGAKPLVELLQEGGWIAPASTPPGEEHDADPK